MRQGETVTCEALIAQPLNRLGVHPGLTSAQCRTSVVRGCRDGGGRIGWHGGWQLCLKEKKYDQPQGARQIIVRVRNGVLVSVTQPINRALSNGMNVYIEGAGNDIRVVPQGCRLTPCSRHRHDGVEHTVGTVRRPHPRIATLVIRAAVNRPHATARWQADEGCAHGHVRWCRG